MKKFVLLLVVGSLLLICGCTDSDEDEMVLDLNAETEEVKAVLDLYIQATETEDIELFSSINAHDSGMVNFGTEATERIVGWDSLKESMEAQFAATENSNLTVRDQVIKVHSSGQVAWFSQIIDWELVFEGQEMTMEGLRATGVLEKRNGNWIFVQMHYSVPAAG